MDNPKSTVSVMVITTLVFEQMPLYVLRAQWASIVTEKRKNR